VTGQSLPEFTRQNIFMPLGMASTQWPDDFRRIVPNRAIAYSGSGSALRAGDLPAGHAV
jgi:CubicO group peptidase (beta-lactamase class C family)